MVILYVYLIVCLFLHFVDPVINCCLTIKSKPEAEQFLQIKISSASFRVIGTTNQDGLILDFWPGDVVSVGMYRLFSPQSRPLAPLAGHQCVPKPDNRSDLSTVFFVWGLLIAGHARPGHKPT